MFVYDKGQEISGVIDSVEELHKVAEILGSTVVNGVEDEGEHFYLSTTNHAGFTIVSTTIKVGDWIWVRADAPDGRFNTLMGN